MKPRDRSGGPRQRSASGSGRGGGARIGGGKTSPGKPSGRARLPGREVRRNAQERPPPVPRVGAAPARLAASRTPGSAPGSVSAESIAIRVIGMAAGQTPADAALREAVRGKVGVSRAVSGEAARLVFTYFRWRGWLDRNARMTDQLAVARELARRFSSEPASFSNDELRRAVPDWVWDHVDLGTDWLRSLQTEPPLWLRARPGQAERLAAELGDASVPHSRVPEGVLYRGSADLFRTAAFHEGRFEVQDLSSQIISLIADPKPGESWWDACAGEGGKTLHLADLMQNKGLVWATDRAEWRLQRLRRRAARSGLFNIRWACWDAEAADAHPPGRGAFDGVLVDAPCSGLGTWQRNPHARWTVMPSDVEELARLQGVLLRRAARGVKSGGRLYYAVCTLTDAETRGVVREFAAASPEFEPLAVPEVFRGGGSDTNQAWIHPHAWNSNGMFLAAFRRTAG